MNLFGWEFSLTRKSAETISLDTLIRRLEAAYETSSGVTVTPETCMQSPTVHAIVTAISHGLASCPVHVYRKTFGSNGRARKELLPDHPVEKLLRKPNQWQSPVEYWQDAASVLQRYGRFCAFKARGVTGPIRRLVPLQPTAVELKQDPETYDVGVKITQENGTPRDYEFKDIHYARGPARDFLNGNSPMHDVREAIALEIAGERFAASFFGGSAIPGIIFKYGEGFQGFKTDEEKRSFLDDFQDKYSRKGRFRAALPPKGVEVAQLMQFIENDKAQMVEARKHQRTVIAGAMGYPLYLVGDLDRQTFNNAEQQAINKSAEVLLPTARIFESAMERDLLTDDDRAAGAIIRFNLDGVLRGDFLARQQGLKIQREAGAINANDWRETEGMNPRTDAGGEAFWDTGPSGQGMQRQQEQPPNGNQTQNN